METDSDSGHVPGSGGSAVAGGRGCDEKCHCCLEYKFEFAFNQANYSDRTLRLEMVEDCPSWVFIGDSAVADGSRKRMRCDNGRSTGSESMHAEEATPTSRVKNIHINSMLLAARSPVFREKFSTEMEGSESHEVTLRIQTSKEAAVTDLLKFMYSDNLSAETPNALLDVFMVAYEFKRPPNLRIVEGIKELVDAALDFLPDILKDITKYQDAALKLPLDRIKAMLSSDDLRFDSEDAIYDFIMKWVRLHFQDLKERREVFQSQLCCLIRFPCMSYNKLMTVLDYCELDPLVATEIVLAALFSKAGKSFLPRAIPTTNHSFYPDLPCSKRAYKLQPVKAIVVDDPYQECAVYLDLKKEECQSEIYTEDFHIGSERFYLMARCNSDEHNQSSNVLGLYLCRRKSRQMKPSLKVDFEVYVMLKYVYKYVFMEGMLLTFKEDDPALGFRNLLDASWDSFMAEGSKYFINGVSHVRANIRIVEEKCLPS